MTTTMEIDQADRGARCAGHRLVSPEWLADRLDDPGVRVVEVDVSPDAYDGGHIAGAALWNIYRDLKDASYQRVGRAALVHLMTRSGIRPGSTVVFYGCAPAMGVWLMELHGHADARILDCSRDVWRAAGHPWGAVGPVPAAERYDLGAPDPHLQADRSAVQASIDRPGVTLVDVRSAPEYRGERFWPSGGMEPGGRAGRVPSAVHQPLDGLYDDRGGFRSPEDLYRAFSALDLDGTDELITYCTIGARAATAWFVLTHQLGRTGVRVYDGSWAEWGRVSGVPVEAARPGLDEPQLGSRPMITIRFPMTKQTREVMQCPSSSANDSTDPRRSGFSREGAASSSW